MNYRNTISHLKNWLLEHHCELIVGLLILQVAYFIWSPLNIQRRFYNRDNPVIRVKTVPVDPRDLLRGNYLILAYDFSNLWYLESQCNKSPTSLPDICTKDQADRTPLDRIRNLPKDMEIYAILEPDDTGLYHTVKLTDQKPTDLKPSQYMIRGFFDGYRTINFNIHKYFIQEGWQQSRDSNIEVELVIDKKHRPHIKMLYVDQQPIIKGKVTPKPQVIGSTPISEI